MAAHLVPIADPSATELTPYLRVRERDLLGREGCFIAEGEFVVRLLATRRKDAILSLLLSERRVHAVADVLEMLGNVPAFVVPQAVMDEVVGFSIHRGVLALGRRPALPDARDMLQNARLVVGLVGLTNHDNVGGIFRSAAALGADAILLDDKTCDPLYRKAIRVSSGTALVVPFARCSSAGEMLDVLEACDIEPVALSPRGTREIDSLGPGRRALLLGAEGPGLSDEVMSRCRAVRIPMQPGIDSLNVGVAGAIALYLAKRAQCT